MASTRPASTGIPISVLLLAHNEEVNLPRCLAALDWCDDVALVDDYSTDRSAEIARDAGARVLQRRFDSFASQRNFALDDASFRHPWVLHLDADEVVTPALVREMAQAVTTGQYLAFRIASKLMWMGRWLRHAANYPVFQVRLGRNPGLRFVEVGHGQREALASSLVGTLKEPYFHYPFSKGLEEWRRKHRRYAAKEAAAVVRGDYGLYGQWRSLWGRDPAERRRALKALSYRLPLRGTLRFLYSYVLCRGFLDGRAGLEYCRLIAWYEGFIAKHVRKLRTSKACGEQE